MRTLGLDLGTKTLGIAISDPSNTIATPVKVIKYPEGDYAYLTKELKNIILEYKITDIALGYPKNMDNSVGFAAQRSLDFSTYLKTFPVKIHLVDERLTTVSALNILKETGNRNIKQKNVVDAVAASLILESYLRGKKDE